MTGTDAHAIKQVKRSTYHNFICYLLGLHRGVEFSRDSRDVSLPISSDADIQGWGVTEYM